MDEMLHTAVSSPLCSRIWGVKCGTPNVVGFSSWRQMYVERVRPRFNGCYISKTTYLRLGENSFQDQFYKPWHIIDYYRYLRLLPIGVVYHLNLLVWCPT